MKSKLLFTAFLNLTLLIANVQAETVNLSVAASMTDAIQEIITQFSSSHPDAKLQPNFASSGGLAKQIAQGAPADLYISANPKWMKYLVEQKLIEPGTDRIFAFNSLVFIGNNIGADINLPTLTKLERLAIGTPQNVPAGQYAKQALENCGVYEDLVKARKLVMAKDVRQALVYADRGEVDGAFVYKTDALLAVNSKIIFNVPGNLYDRVAYPLGLTIQGGKNKSARAFYTFMSSPGAVAILEKYGFQTAHQEP